MLENRKRPFASAQPAIAFFLLFALAFLAACHHPDAQRRYPLTGEIIAVDRSSHQLIVRNDDIPNFMKAMTMPFAVKDPAVLGHLQIGQRIRATLVVTSTESWLEDVQVTAQAPADASAPHSDFQIPSEGTPVPDFVFTNQDCKRVHLAQYKGKVVLLTFIYTRCPMPDFCPRMMNNFREIEDSLRHDPAAYGRTHLLSITFDPDFDTPKVLRHYALSTTSIPAADLFPHWEFLSPRTQDLDAIAHFFALSVWKENGGKDKGQITHSLSTAIVDGSGKLYRWYHGNDWTPDELLREAQAASGAN
ncbi:MAG: SCO family protein [Terriglobales bacterium]